MNVVEEIRCYIESVKIPEDSKIFFDMSFCEALEIRNCLGSLEAIALAFDYGRAKGYQAAKHEN